MRNVFKRAHKLHSQNGRQKEQTYLIAVKKRSGAQKRPRAAQSVARTHTHIHVYMQINKSSNKCIINKYKGTHTHTYTQI